MEKSFQTTEQLSDFFTTLSRGTTPDPESADISTSATDPEQPKPPTPLLPSTELDSHAVPQEKLPYRFTGNTTDLLGSPVGFERARGADIYATMPRRKPRSKVATCTSVAHGNDGACATPVSAGQPPSPKKPLIAGTHPRSAAARRAEGFSELLQFTRQQQFTPLGDMDITQSLPSFASGQLSLDDTRGIPVEEDEDKLCDDFGEGGGVGIAVSKSSYPPQPSGEVLDKPPFPNQGDSNKVSTIPQLQAVPEDGEFLHVEEANGKAEFAISPPPPLDDSDHEKEASVPPIRVIAADSEEKLETVETSDHKSRDSVPSTHDTADDLDEKSEAVESRGLLDDAKTDTELATSSPVSDTAENGDTELKEKSSNAISLTESPMEKPEDSEVVTESIKLEESNGRDEFTSPPLADSDDDMEDKENIATESSVQKKSEETNIMSVDCELSDSSTSADNGESRSPQTTVHDHEAASDTNKANTFQQNGDSPYHLRHRVTGVAEQQTEQEQEHQPEMEIDDLSDSITTRSTSREPSDSASTSILDSSREERESSVDSITDESHSGLIQQSSRLRSHHGSSQAATGVLGWLHGVSRNVLFGFIPRTVGLRGGLIVVGVAAISSLLLYNLTGYTSANSTAGGR